MRFFEVFNNRILTVSNLLSVLRILLVPVFWYFLERKQHNPKYDIYALIVVVVMILTDFFDGFLARKLGQETLLGQYLDPVADKIAIVGGLFLLHHYTSFPLWLVLFVLLREVIGIYLGAFLFFKRDVLGQPNYWGKIGVFFIAISGFFYLMDWPYKDLILLLVVFTLLGGGVVYFKTYWKTLFGDKSI